MGLIGVNSPGNRTRPISKMENIAMGVDMASKILGQGLDAYKLFGIEKPKAQADMAESSARAKLLTAQALDEPGDKERKRRLEDAQIEYYKIAKPAEAAKAVSEAEEANKKYSGDLAPLNKIPKGSREEAAKELGTLKAHGAVENDAMAAFNELNETSSGSALIPGMIGGNKASYDAARAKLAASLMAKVPGIRSDSDFRNIVDPLLPKPFDSDAEKAQKAENFRSWIQSQRPQAPLLNSVGVDVNSVLGIKDPETEAAKKWLKENPNDERAPLIRKRLGL